MNKVKVNQLKQRRKRRVHRNVRSSNKNNRKRITFHASNKYLYAQLVDDSAGKTLLTVTTLGQKGAKTRASSGELAGNFVTKLQEKKIDAGEDFVFDRGGRLFHGRVKVFADALREKGLKF